MSLYIRRRFVFNSVEIKINLNYLLHIKYKVNLSITFLNNCHFDLCACRISVYEFFIFTSKKLFCLVANNQPFTLTFNSSSLVNYSPFHHRRKCENRQVLNSDYKMYMFKNILFELSEETPCQCCSISASFVTKKDPTITRRHLSSFFVPYCSSQLLEYVTVRC